jgi:putative transcriptional regulator
MISQLQPTVGRLLISEPFLLDANFKRSVVLIMEQEEEEGTMGFILNQRSTLLLKDIISDMGEHADFPVYFGGPVEMDTVHFIHRCPEQLLGAQEIAKGIYWGGNFETLKILVQNNSIKAEDIKFFLGYSGWGSGQLAQEMLENTWIVSDQYHPDVVFSDNEENLWREVIINLGPKYAHVSNFPSDPNLN